MDFSRKRWSNRHFAHPHGRHWRDHTAMRDAVLHDNTLCRLKVQWRWEDARLWTVFGWVGTHQLLILHIIKGVCSRNQFDTVLIFPILSVVDT
jgi:hypothetical protein